MIVQQSLMIILISIITSLLTKCITNDKIEYLNLLVGNSSYQAVIGEIRICFPIEGFIG